MPIKTSIKTKLPNKSGKPKARAIETVHKKFGGTAHPHVSHSWTHKTMKKRVYVKGYYSKTGKWIKPHYTYKTVKVKSNHD